jgi:hypothetical protein
VVSKAREQFIMGSCFSKQQAAAVAASEPNSSTVEAAVPETKAHVSAHGAAKTDPAAGNGSTAAEAPTGEAEEYTGAIAPVCELQRRQHLNNLGILYTVSVQMDHVLDTDMLSMATVTAEQAR